MTIGFSTQPGCRERQLQRRHNNPLFPESRRQVTAEELAAARNEDQREQDEFRRQFNALLEEAATLPPEADSELVLNLRSRIDPLYDQCASFGPGFAALRDGLDRLYDIIMQAIRKAAGADPLAQRELAEEDAARHAHVALLRFPLVATLLRPEEIIPADELVPTLLSEPEDSLQAALQLFDPEQLRILTGSASTLLSRLRADGIELEDAEARLGLMRRYLATTSPGVSH